MTGAAVPGEARRGGRGRRVPGRRCRCAHRVLRSGALWQVGPIRFRPSRFGRSWRVEEHAGLV